MDVKSKARACTLCLLVLLALFTAASAQWERDGAIIIEGSYPILGEMIIPDQNHGAIVIWKDGHLGSAAIFAQKIDSAGYQLWEDDGAFIGWTTMMYAHETVTTNGNGGAIVAWENYLVDYTDIYGQQINNEGAIQWSDTGLAITDWYGEELGVSIVSDNHGGAIIACWGDDYGVPRIVVQRVDSMGNLLYGDIGIPLTNLLDSLTNQVAPKLNQTSDSNFVCVWSDNREIEPGPGLYAQKFDIDGNLLWNPAGVPVAVDPAIEPSGLIAPNLQGGFYCLWSDGRYSGYHASLFLQHIDSTGQQSWITGGIEISYGVHNYYPHLVVNSENNALVCWEESDENYILCNIINIMGEKLWSSDVVAMENSTSVRGLTMSIENEFEICCKLRETPQKRIQKVSMSGELLFGEEGIAFGLPDGPLNSMASVTDSMGGVIVLTLRTNTGPLYVHRIYANGHVGGDTLTYIDEDNIPSEYRLSLSNYPNPFNSSTTIIYHVANIGPIPAEIKIDIYDILGRKVRTLINERKEVGEHKITWDGRDDNVVDLPSGVYFARIVQWGMKKHLSFQKKLVLIR